jgi:predicted Fe-Mo cluster-binding NifX family protein
MKIAISSEASDLEAKVGQRLGISNYLLIIDLKSMKIEAIPNPTGSRPGGGGMQMVALAIDKKVCSILTGSCSPVAEKYLSSSGIEVITGVSDTVEQAVKGYKEGYYQNQKATGTESDSQSTKIGRISIVQALQRSKNQFINILPILVGVVLLVGLFSAFASKDLLLTIFSGNMFKDLLSGAICGSILAGNPVNSYIIGGELLDRGVSLFAVTAFIMAWVTVGIVQLPAEMAALGKRFALIRNISSFILSMLIALVAVNILKYI